MTADTAGARSYLQILYAKVENKIDFYFGNNSARSAKFCTFSVKNVKEFGLLGAFDEICFGFSFTYYYSG